ncbi:IclR family transcriptional regulator (plasmid) [Halococcus dombrowskii]|uniref:IclR family transcriptional regulator n=1 Tax=Halococcus dombrowskii TaxID=179637 RepID=A0AAX3ATC9_HALDO|nr:IclR family transcriptional regulator [Halococcus dombrowskii]UOO96811.1 IclR family transcriptional regulator [Halococcus dombrowskii]
MQPKAKNPVKSDMMLFDILEALESAKEARLTEIADQVRTTKSTVHNHLNTLRERGYVVKQGQKYSLSYRFLKMGEQSRYRTPLYEFARPVADELSHEENLLVNICVEENGKSVHLYRTKENSELRFSTQAGEATYMHCVSVGKAILSQLPRERVNNIVSHYGLPSRTKNTITNKNALREELDSVEDAGVAFDNEEYAEGLCCVASPIAGTDGSILGGISITGPATDLTGEYYRKDLPSKVQRAANIIELNLNKY